MIFSFGFASTKAITPSSPIRPNSYFATKSEDVIQRYLWTLAAVFCLGGSSLAQNDPGGASAAGMAHTGLNQTDVWSLFHNPAGSAEIEAFTAGVFYENRFLVDGLAYGGFGAAMSLGTGTIGVKYSNFGYDVYRESQIGATYAMKLTDRLSAGVGLNYHAVRIDAEDYGKTGDVSAEAGLRMQLSQKVFAAAHVSNITRSQLNEYDDERLPTRLGVGLGYQMADEVLLVGEVVKDIDHDPSFRAGIEYRPVKILFLRMGASSGNELLAFGLGLQFESFRFDLATTYGTALGYSPQVSLTYRPEGE